MEMIVTYFRLLCRTSSGLNEENDTKPKDGGFTIRPRIELDTSTNYKYIIEGESNTKISVVRDGVWTEI